MGWGNRRQQGGNKEGNKEGNQKRAIKQRMGNMGQKETQRLYQLEGTPQSSTTQLTDPTLYSIFGGRHSVYTENEDIELSAAPLAKSRGRGDVGNDSSRQQQQKKQQTQQQKRPAAVSLALNVLKTSVFGVALCLLFGSVHESNPDTIPDFRRGSVPTMVLSSFVLDVSICAVLYLLKRLGFRSISASTSTSSTSILQLSVALLGIAYCFKKLPWSSTLQADLTLLLLDVFFSRYVGCTAEEVLTAVVVFAASCAYDVLGGSPSFELSLWRAAFLFFTTVVFIKLRRSDTLF